MKPIRKQQWEDFMKKELTKSSVASNENSRISVWTETNKIRKWRRNQRSTGKRRTGSAVKTPYMQSKYDLVTAYDTVIHIYGPLQLQVNLGLKRVYSWSITVADIRKPTIGVDFLSFYNLLEDCRNQRLVDNVTALSVPATHCDSVNIASVKAFVGDTDYHQVSP